MPEQLLRNQVAVVAGATRGAGRGIAVRTDHTVESEVEQLFARVRAEAGRLDILVNDIWGGDALTEWGKPFWELSIASDLHAHHVTALAITPGFLRSEAVLDFFGVTEANWRDAIEEDPYFAESETPCLVGRAVAALAAARTGAPSSRARCRRSGRALADRTLPLFEYRINFGRDGDTLIVLLGGGTKARQQRDIENAGHLWREYRLRKREED